MVNNIIFNNNNSHINNNNNGNRIKKLIWCSVAISIYIFKRLEFEFLSYPSNHNHSLGERYYMCKRTII